MPYRLPDRGHGWLEAWPTLPHVGASRPIVAIAFVVAVSLLGIAARAGLGYASRGYVNHDDALSLFESQAPQSRMLVFDTMPPLYSRTLSVWNQLFGIGVLQARMLSVFFSVLTLAVIYVMARYLFDRRVALLSLLLLAVSQLSVLFGQMIRPYAMFQFLALLCCYLFVRSLREQRLAWWMAFVASSILTMYTHYYGVLVIAALTVCALICRKRYRIRASWIAGAAAAGFVSYLPWLAALRSGSPTDLRRFYTVHANGLPWYFVVHWGTFFRILREFNNGISAGWRTFAAGILLFSLPAAVALASAVRKSLSRNTRDDMAQSPDLEGTVIVAVLWLFPVLVLLAAGALGLPFTDRYVLFCAAPYYILVAFGISKSKIRALRLGLIALIVPYSVYSIAYTFSQRSDAARQVMAHIQANLRAGDCGMFLWSITAPPSWLTLWDAPRTSLPLAPTPLAPVDRVSFRLISPADLPGAFTRCRRVWVVKGGDADLGPASAQLKRLDEEAMRVLGPGHSRDEEFSGGGFNASLYSRIGT